MLRKERKALLFYDVSSLVHLFGNFWALWGPDLNKDAFFRTRRREPTVSQSRWPPVPSLGMTTAANPFALGLLGSLGPAPAEMITVLQPRRALEKLDNFAEKPLQEGE